MENNERRAERRHIRVVGTVVDAVENAADETSEYENNDIENNKGIAALAYIGILFFVPLIVCPKSKFARFHANQGLIFLVFCIAAGIVMSVIGALLTWRLRIIASIINALIGIAMLILFVSGLKNSLNGYAKELPFIGKIRFFK